jgi:nucleoside 2-deoxyribosyltransferase
MRNFDIFLGGPMGDKGDDGQGTAYGSHLTNLANAVKTISNNILIDSEHCKIQVLNPDVQDVGSISKRVFSLIDRADLAIMDVSIANESVMYEIAYLHALGVPVIPVDILRPEGNNVSFYLKEEYIAWVDNFEVNSLVTALEAKIRSVLGLSHEITDPTSNPISNYYGVPLIDASATAGLATGYFHNFLRHLVKENNSVFHKNPTLQHMVVLVPQSLNEVSQMRYTVTHALNTKGHDIDMVDEENGNLYKEEDQVRGQLLLMSTGNTVFDIPAPLSAQKSSPRYLRLLEQISRTKGPHKDDLLSLKARMEQQTIERFFSVLEVLLQQPQLNAERVKFLSLDEFITRFD